MPFANVGSKYYFMWILVYVIWMFLKTTVEAFSSYTSFWNISCDAWSCQHNVYWRPSNIRGYFRDMSCLCDQYCATLGDCCYDYNSTSKGNTEPVRDFKEYLGCHDDSGVSKEDKFLAVVRCPKEWTGSEISSLCKSDNISDIMLRLPVTGNVSGLVYRNVYCAVCHRESYQYWRLTVDCDSRTPLGFDANSSIEELLDDSKCHLKFLPPHSGGSYRPCVSDVIQTCAVGYNDTEVIDVCTSSEGMRLVYSRSGLVFKNVECALCNFEVPICESAKYYTVIHSTRSRSFYSFSILLDLNTRSGSTKVGTRSRRVESRVNITHTCAEFQVFDPFIQACRDVYNWRRSEVTHLDIPQRPRVKIVYKLNVTMTCPLIRLNYSEFSIHDDGTLHSLSGYTFDRSEYYVEGIFAYVCTNLTQNYTETTTIFDAKIDFSFSVTTSIITSVGLFLSLLGLLITMTIYLFFKSLRNIPGKIIVSLASSLFFAEGFLLFASQVEEYPIICKTFGILMHYLFLEAFLWMNVMAGDVWFTFSKSFVKAGDSGKSSKRFCFYSVYVRVTAIILVTSAIIVENVLPESQFRPNYGAGLCWFTNKRGLLVFFAAPVFLLILMNIVFFSIAARSIYYAKRKSAVYLAKQENVQFSIYLKLAVVMGLTWTFGFLASVFPFTVMWYIYIIFNTLQGLFICIGFVFTRKVLFLVRDRISSLRRRSSASDQMPSSPTRSTELTFRVADRGR